MLPSRGGYKGPFKSLSADEKNIRNEIKTSVNFLAGKLGERNIYQKEQLDAAANFIFTQFKEAGLDVSEQTYLVGPLTLKNIIGEKKGDNKEAIIIGAHYDSVPGSPGADDNASGVAGIIAIANCLKKIHCFYTVRFVAFCTEESPYFYSQQMGSWHYAHLLKSNNEKLKGMFSIESIGYYSSEQNSQHYPFFLGVIYPNQANFIGFVSNFASTKLLNTSLSSFREHVEFPSEGIAAPTIIPGISWSDHWAFWKMGYKAIMITDTVPYRNPNYHTPYDLPDTLDYDRMARVVNGLKGMLCDLANEKNS